MNLYTSCECECDTDSVTSLCDCMRVVDVACSVTLGQCICRLLVLVPSV